MDDFGQMLRRLRTEAGLSLRAFADKAGIDFSYVGQIERGERRCSPDWAEICDQTLRADGALLEAYRADAGKEDDVRRRSMLTAVVGVPPMIAFEALRADSVPMAGTEALRRDLTSALGGHAADVAEWEEIAWNYGCTYAETPPKILFEDLRVDLLVARTQLAAVTDDATQHSMQRVIALLAAFMAQTFGNLGDTRAGYRWWRTARSYADASRDGEARMWVRGREIIRGMYELRPLVTLLTLADEADAISDTVGMGTCAVLAGRAQALAMLGRTADATAALGRVYDAAERLPAQVLDDTASMYGWPEHRLRHSESYVHTYLGDDERAEDAHDRALSLYPDNMFRERAQVELHSAMRLVRAGDAGGGADHAQRVVQRLPDEQRIAVVLELARSVASSVPPSERGRPQVAGLREMLALPAAPAR